MSPCSKWPYERESSFFPGASLYMIHNSCTYFNRLSLCASIWGLCRVVELLMFWLVTIVVVFFILSIFVLWTGSRIYIYQCTMWGFKDITVVRFSNADAQIETLVYPHFCSRYPWESIWACIGLSLLIFFCVYICLCKKAYHLLLDQPLPMAPPLLLSLLLLPPLPPSLRPSTQVSARFSSAKTYPPQHHFPAPSPFPVFCCSPPPHSCN